MLLVKDLMNEALESVSPDDSLQQALTKMNRAGYRHLPVVDDGTLVGMVTDRDVRLAVNSPVVDEQSDLKRQYVLEDIYVDQCMTPDPMCVSSSQPAREVADLLTLHKFGALPVVDDGKLVGMVSYIDFLKHFAANN